MSRADRKHYELTDAERRDLAKLLDEGKPLPEKYRFILFEDKREVELVWNGKTRDVCTTVLPFQSLEHIDEPRREAPASPQQDLFDPRGRQVKGWTNKLIWGDNKLILSSLKSGPLREQIEEAGGLKLIYIDPPFDVGADFSMDIEIGGETFHKEPNILEQIAYRDTWGRGADSYISMIYERLVLMRDLLRADGSIYVHCDWRMVGVLRVVLEEVFGFVENVISWKRSALAASVKAQWRNSQDFILFFSKSGRHTFNPQFGEYSESSKKHYSHRDQRGVFQPVPLLASGRSRGETGQPWRGIDPNRLGKNGMHWLKKPSVLDQLDAQGLIYWPTKEGGSPRLKFYEEEAKGVYVSDFWADIDVINSMADEYQSYNTQKPEALIDRIIRASSNEGDLVADFFCGSGTTAAVAEKLGRKWIATDLGKFAIHTTRKRLIGVQRQLQAEGKPFRAFEILNLGRYERQAYLNVGGRLSGAQKEAALDEKARQFRELILRAYKAQPLADTSFFHGQFNGRLVVIGPINLPVGRLFVEEVIVECRKRGASRVDLLAFEFEMGLFPAVLDEARARGGARAGGVSRHQLHRGHAALRQEEQVQRADRADRLFRLLHAGRAGRGRQEPEGRQEPGGVRRRAALQARQEQGRRVQARAADQALDRLGRLLGGGLQLREPQGSHQAPAQPGGGPGAGRLRAAAGRVGRIRRLVDRRLPVRERVAKLPHPPEP